MTEVERYELALRRIMGTFCETFTGCQYAKTTLGDCLRNGRMIDAIYGADRACDPCHAWSVLYPAEAAEIDVEVTE